LWGQAAAQALASIETADRKARWPGGLTIRVDGITATGGMSGGGGTSGAWTITPATFPPYLDIIASGPLPAGFDGDVNIRNGTAGPITITMPTSPILGQRLRFKDILGNAGTYAITLAGPVDGSTSYAMVTDYRAVELAWLGTQWGTR